MCIKSELGLSLSRCKWKSLFSKNRPYFYRLGIILKVCNMCFKSELGLKPNTSAFPIPTNNIFFSVNLICFVKFFEKIEFCFIALFYSSKGQLISEWLFGVFNTNAKIWWISALKSKKWSNQKDKGTLLC